MYSPRLYKYRDSSELYIPTVHTFGLINFAHTLLVQTHTHDVPSPWIFRNLLFINIFKYLLTIIYSKKF